MRDYKNLFSNNMIWKEENDENDMWEMELKEMKKI